MDKENAMYTCIMEYHSAMKKNEILSFATISINPEDIMLSGINQRKSGTIWSHSCVESNKRQQIKTELMDRTDWWSPEMGVGEMREES